MGKRLTQSRKYLSPKLEGYLGNIVMILDLIDPAHPREVGRWWLPGQWIAGSETPTWNDRAHRPRRKSIVLATMTNRP